MGQSPMALLCIMAGNLNEIMNANNTNNVPITPEKVKNLKEYLTVPSRRSWVRAVGIYESKLNNRYNNYGCTNGPVNILHT